MKKGLRRFVLGLSRCLDFLSDRIAGQWPGIESARNDATLVSLQSRTQTIEHASPIGPMTLEIYVPNQVCRYRADTFSTKEPETLAWINRFGGEGPFFDIGANIGLYSIYCAKTFGQSVYAFEPSAKNLGLLVGNIALNEVSDLVTVVPNPLTEKNCESTFRLSMLEEGGSMATFGEEFGHDGNPLDVLLEYRTVGLSLDSLATLGLISDSPALMKIDVDGIEHLVLKGGENLLQSKNLVTVLVEVNDEFRSLAAQVEGALVNAGYALEEKARSSIFDDSNFARSFNQIWVKR